jgi:predicted MFS family arabinose efflux permease
MKTDQKEKLNGKEISKVDKIPGRGLLLVSCSWYFQFLTGFGSLCLGMLIPKIQEQFNLSLTTTGYLSTITFGSKMVLLIPLALLGTRKSPKFMIGLVFTLIVTSFFCQGFANGYLMLATGRILLGVGLAGIMALMAIIKVSWIPLSKISQINGIDFFSQTVGQVVGTTLLTTLIMLFGNWQILMIALGVLGGIVTFVWFYAYKNNPDNPVKLSTGIPLFASLKEAVKEKSVWLLAIGWPGTSFVWCVFTTFWPTYAIENLGFSTIKTGVIIGMIPVASALACIITPQITKKIGYDKPMIWPWGLILCVSYYLCLQISNFVLLCIMFFIVGFGAFAFVPISYSLPYKLKTLSPSAVAISISLVSTTTSIATALAAVVVGKLTAYMSLKSSLTLCCLSPLLWFATTIFLPEFGSKRKTR